jgi:hypothetical protein
MIFGSVTFDLVQRLHLSKSDVLALILKAERLAPGAGVNLVTVADHSRNSS